MSLKATEDVLLQEVSRGLDARELADNPHFVFLMDTLKNDAVIAMQDLVECSWWKFLMIRRYQNKVWRYTGLKRRIEEIIQVGLTAELELKELDALDQQIRIEE